MTAPPVAGARWQLVDQPPEGDVEILHRALGMPRPLATVLAQRGYAEPIRARAFLRPSLDGLTDPQALPDLPRAVEVIAAHVRRGSPILIHGDYDVDGQCATALVTRALRAAGASVVPFVPHRLHHGYDFGVAGLERALQVGASLIVTCDCGIGAHETVAAARARGIDVVVTDHHRLPERLPDATAVVNPRRPGTPEASESLCGAGVAFKVVQALVPALGLPGAYALHLLDYVALATVADLVPLTGENRTLVRFGLRLLAQSRWSGLRALLEACGLAGKAVDAGQVGFILAPRLNAVGRIGDANDGLKLLLADEPGEAATLAAQLETWNSRRQDLDQRILAEAVEVIERSAEHQDAYALVLESDRWHSGVIGIVASRLVDRYAKPALLVAWDGPGGRGRGSGRSIPALDLYAALTGAAGALERFGGHRMAAGLLVRRDAFPSFRREFLRAVEARLTPDDLVARQRVDLEVPLAAMDLPLADWARRLEPCGAGNPAPVYGVRGARLMAPRVVGGTHLRFTLEDPTARLTAIAFGWAERVPERWREAPLDVAFRIERHEWRGQVSVEARIVTLGPAA